MSLNHWSELSRWQSRGGVHVHESKPGIWTCDLLDHNDRDGLRFLVRAVGTTPDAAVIAALTEAGT